MQLSTPARDIVYTAWRTGVRVFGAHAKDVVLWPQIESQAQMEDLLPRLHFHFASLPENARLVVPCIDNTVRARGRRPYYLDAYAGRFKARIAYTRTARNTTPWALALNYRGVLLTQPAASIPGGEKIQYLPNVAPIHPDDVEMPTFWIAKLLHRAAWTGSRQAMETLRKYTRRLPKKKRVYMLLTGPSLSRFREFDFSDGYVIACNSIVSNDELMAHARPDFVTACDPIFHFGPSTYAEKFRRDLARAAKQYPFLFLTLADYHHLMKPHLGLANDRFCLVPKSTAMAYRSLAERWAVSQTANVMTMFMMPLALMLARDIYVIGADGREPGETYFWKHDPASQLTEEMRAIKDCHPAFFEKRNYEDYYAQHCGHVRHWVDAIEERGGRVYTLTPSHVPALSGRLATGGV